MTSLRQRMVGNMQVRNFSPHTLKSSTGRRRALPDCACNRAFSPCNVPTAPARNRAALSRARLAPIPKASRNVSRTHSSALRSATAANTRVESSRCLRRFWSRLAFQQNQKLQHFHRVHDSTEIGDNLLQLPKRKFWRRSQYGYH